MPTTAEGVKFAINTILQDKAKHTTSLNYAVNYCKAALNMEGNELAVQCLYILNNITGWRHPKAAATRAVLRDYAKNEH